MSAKRSHTGKAIRCQTGKAGTSCCDTIPQVIPGEWCDCNEGTDPEIAYTIPAEGVKFSVFLLIGGKCYEFDPLNARDPDGADVDAGSGEGSFSDCDECCDHAEPPECCDTFTKACFDIDAAFDATGTVTMTHEITCLPSASTLVDASNTLLANHSGVGFTAGASECESMNASVGTPVDVDYDYDRFCLSDIRTDTVTELAAIAVNYESEFSSSDPAWTQDLTFSAVAISVSLPSVYIEGGATPLGLPTEMTMTRNQFAEVTNTIGTTESVSVSVDIDNACQWSITWTWDASQTRNYPAYSIDWSSSGSVTVTINGFGRCDGGSTEPARMMAVATTRRPIVTPGLVAGPDRVTKSPNRLNSGARRRV